MIYFIPMLDVKNANPLFIYMLINLKAWRTFQMIKIFLQANFLGFVLDIDISMNIFGVSC